MTHSISLSVNGVLKTSDGFLVVTQRALWVGEHPGMLDTPGGHPEPSNVDSKFNLKFNSTDCFDSVDKMDPKQVSVEIFKSQKEEMELEFNINRKSSKMTDLQTCSMSE